MSTADNPAFLGRARLGIDNQTVFGLPPVEHVALAAELGCGHVSLAVGPVPWKLDRFPGWSLLDDAALRRDTAAALRDTGVRLALAEGFTIRPQTEARDRVREFDLMAGLGAERAAAVSMEPDPGRALAQMAILADLAAERGMIFAFEFAPPHTFNTLAAAHAALRRIERPNARLLIDAMHLFRTGGTVAELAALDPATIGYAQLCDAALHGDGGDYYREASFERLVPGTGELPLAALLRALPPDIPLGLEVPRQTALREAEDYRQPIARIVTEAERLVIADQAAR